MWAAQNESRSGEDLRRMAALISHGEAWTSETGSHFAMYDDQHNYFKALLSFLQE